MTHDISSTPAESEPCMWGRATLVMLVSSTCMIVTIITENVMAHLRAELMEPSVVTRRTRATLAHPPTEPALTGPVPAAYLHQNGPPPSGQARDDSARTVSDGGRNAG